MDTMAVSTNIPGMVAMQASTGGAALANEIVQGSLGSVSAAKSGDISEPLMEFQGDVLANLSVGATVDIMAL